MAPYQGSGAGQAIEARFSRSILLLSSVPDDEYLVIQDAYLLATLLGHPNTTLDSAAFALQVYDNIRRPFATKVAHESRLCGQYYTLKFDDVDFEQLSQPALQQRLSDLGESILQSWQWSWTTTLESDVQRAISLLTHS